MKYISVVAPLIIGLSSCTSYQYVSLKSELKQTTESNHYYYQDEHVYIDFDFSGADFPTSIFLENTGRNPLYLDMEKTLFLENDVILRNAIPGNTGHLSTFIDYEGQVSGITVTDENPNIVYIPSGEKIIMNYTVFGYPYNEGAKVKSTPKMEKVKGYNYKIKSVELSKSQSPNYEIDLYFYTDSTLENGYDVIALFWPNKIYSLNQQPKDFPIKNPNLFHTSKRNEDAEVLAYLTVMGLSLTAIILMPDYEEQ